MFKLVLPLLFLALSGLQALPIAPMRDLPKESSTSVLSEDSNSIKLLPEGFQQGTEPSKRFFDTGLVQDHIGEMSRRTGFIHNLVENGLGEIETKHWLADEVPIDVPAQKNGDGWVRVEEPSSSQLPDGFRQGTEPFMPIPDGFRQGTEPSLSIPDGFRQGTEPFMSIPDGFRQGTEPFMSIPDGFRQGTEPFMSIPDGFRQGTEPSLSIPDGFRQGTEPFMSIPDGFRQGTEPSLSIPDGFRQGTEPFMSIPDGFRQGTEPFMSIPDGFRQGTEPTIVSHSRSFKQDAESFVSIPDGFRQGTEPFMPIPDGFRQGTEPVVSIPHGFRQGTEPTKYIPRGFRQGTEPSLHIPVGFRQGTEPSIKNKEGQVRSSSRLQTQACKGEVVNGNCYEFNPTPLTFKEAQDLCQTLNPQAELASVTSGDLHSRLVSMVTKGGQISPQLTWLGAVVKNQQGSWVDGSE
uniref:uncharacterized protein LOC131104381 n=1 Tax=Doryrhamphus excisus TaxID=161450 RepID=UPI0025AE5B64|nr:uncharacterized protein LOC131104381 [Doryrhamphus excisus]